MFKTYGESSVKVFISKGKKKNLVHKKHIISITHYYTHFRLYVAHFSLLLFTEDSFRDVCRCQWNFLMDKQNFLKSWGLTNRGSIFPAQFSWLSVNCSYRDTQNKSKMIQLTLISVNMLGSLTKFEYKIKCD